MTRFVTLLLLAATTSGCIEGELDRKSIVNRWRVLAIQASLPEARPGMDVVLAPLVVTPEGEHAAHGVDGVRFRWFACIRAEQVPGLGGVQYDPEDPSDACGAADPRLRMELDAREDGSALVEGEVTDLLWPDPDMLSEAAREMFGEAISPEVVARLLSTVGIQLTIELVVAQDGEEIMRAYKRITLVDRETLGTNPPEPRYRIGDVWISGRGVDAPWTCEPEEGEMPTLQGREEVILSPDPDDEGWREGYWVLDITGALTQVRERPYYAFLSTDGAFDQEVTRAPIREEIWRAPEEPGTYPLWLVVRDGHGGMSACRTMVEVR